MPQTTFPAENNPIILWEPVRKFLFRGIWMTPLYLLCACPIAFVYSRLHLGTFVDGALIGLGIAIGTLHTRRALIIDARYVSIGNTSSLFASAKRAVEKEKCACLSDVLTSKIVECRNCYRLVLRMQDGRELEWKFQASHASLSDVQQRLALLLPCTLVSEGEG